MTSHSRSYIYSLAVLPGPQVLVLRTHLQKRNNVLELWDLDSGKRLVETSVLEPLASLLAVGDGIAATSGREGVVRLWSLPSVEPLGEVDLRVPLPKGTRAHGHENTVGSFAFLPGSRRAVATKYNHISVWDLKTKRSLREFGEDSYWSGSIAVLPGGRRLLTTGDRRLRLWDLGSGKCLRNLVEKGLPAFKQYLDAQDPQSATDACVLGDGRRAVATYGDGRLRCWDLETGALLQKVQAASGELAWLDCIAADGDRVLAGGFDRHLWLWTPGGEPVALEGHIGEITGLSFLPGGRAVSCSFDQTIRVWDLEKRACLRVLGTPKESSQWPPNESRY